MEYVEMKLLVPILIILLIPLSASAAPNNSTLDLFEGGTPSESIDKSGKDTEEVIVCKIPGYGVRIINSKSDKHEKDTYEIYRCLWA